MRMLDIRPLTHQIGTREMLFRVRDKEASLLPKLVDSLGLRNAKTMVSERLKTWNNMIEYSYNSIY